MWRWARSELEWTVAGFGDFSGTARRDRHADAQRQHRRIRGLRHRQQRHHVLPGRWARSGWNGRSRALAISPGRANETDMLMRNSNTGAFEVYDISNNTITSAAPMGQVGLEWQVAGFGDFSGRADETDMLMRNSNTGAFEVYDISNNAITSPPHGSGRPGMDDCGLRRFLRQRQRNRHADAQHQYRRIRSSTTSATTPSRRRPRWARWLEWSLGGRRPMLRSRRQAPSSVSPQSIQRPRRSASSPRQWRRSLRLVPRPGRHRQSVKLHRQRQSVPTC